MKKSFKLYCDALDILEELSDEEAGMLFRMIHAYQTGKEIKVDRYIAIAFTPFKKQFERDNEAYRQACETNKANGLKGGRPKANKPNGLIHNPKNPNKGDKDKDKDKDKIGDTNAYERVPPSQRKRVGQYIPKEFKNFMEMKDHLASNHEQYKKIDIEFEEEVWKIGKQGIPYSTKTVADMPFEQRKRFWLHLINYKHLLKG